MKFITSVQNEPHVTPLQDAMWHKGLWSGDCIISQDEDMKAELISNNEIRIKSGVASFQGRFFCIEPGTYDSVTINNGTQSEKRIDLIVAHYESNEETHTQSMDWKVIQGTPAASNPQVPSYTEGDLDSDLVAEMPFFEVHLDGINITDIVPLVSVQGGCYISDETVEAFRAIGWDPEGGAVIESLINLIFDRAHPVGSYYWSSDPTDPATLFGGTWEQVTDKFVLAAGNTYKVGAVGGEASHALTIEEIPSHDGHLQNNTGHSTIGNINAFLPNSSLREYMAGPRGWQNDGGGEVLPAGMSRGGGQAHNNMPPYVVAYCWRRTG